MEVLIRMHPIDFDRIEVYAIGKAYLIATIHIDTLLGHSEMAGRLEEGEEIKLDIMEVVR